MYTQICLYIRMYVYARLYIYKYRHICSLRFDWLPSVSVIRPYPEGGTCRVHFFHRVALRPKATKGPLRASYTEPRASVLGIVTMVLGRYLIVGYLDPQGPLHMGPSRLMRLTTRLLLAPFKGFAQGAKLSWKGSVLCL